jgi:hypothetical protein
MNRLLIISALISVLIFSGCGDQQKNKRESIGVHKFAGVEADSLSYMQLNAGERWLANKETTEGIKMMTEIVQNQAVYVSADSLKNSLEAEMNKIFQKCTMKGEAHEQLHSYLFPLKEKIAALEEDNQEKGIMDIDSYLSKYLHYFQ